MDGIVKASQELADISEKNPEYLTENDKKKLEMFEKIKSRNLDEKELLECVLNLSVSEDTKQIYLERYEVNSELVESNEENLKKLETQIANKPIKIKRKTLGKNLFFGKNAITEREIRDTRKDIEQELEETQKDEFLK